MSMNELTPKEMAEAKKLARRVRVGNIRRRIAYGATLMVAVFSGAILFRSLEQQTGTAATNVSAVTRSDESDDSEGLSALVTQVSSAFGDDGEEEGSPSTTEGTVTGSTTTSTAPPLVTSQS